jgi:hypothetical protein
MEKKAGLLSVWSPRYALLGKSTPREPWFGRWVLIVGLSLMKDQRLLALRLMGDRGLLHPSQVRGVLFPSSLPIPPPQTVSRGQGLRLHYLGVEDVVVHVKVCTEDRELTVRTALNDVSSCTSWKTSGESVDASSL